MTAPRPGMYDEEDSSVILSTTSAGISPAASTTWQEASPQEASPLRLGIHESEPEYIVLPSGDQIDLDRPAKESHKEWDFPEQKVRQGAYCFLKGVEPVLVCLFLLAFGLSGILAASQFAAYLAAIATLPPVPWWFCFLAACLLVLLVIISFCGLAILYTQLKPSPRVNRGALEELQKRAETRQKAAAATVSAEKSLRSLLEQYPADDDHCRFLRRAGLQAGDDDRTMIDGVLHRQKKRLLDANHGIPNQWIDDFDQRFLQPLDEVADDVIKRYRTLVGVKTALAPTGLMDTLVVLINSWLLIRDLCKIYNVRANWRDTTWILISAVVNAAAASQLEDASQSFGQTEEEIADAVPTFLGQVAAGIVGNVTGQVGRRVAEGAANALLLSRLGRITRDRLRPIMT